MNAVLQQPLQQQQPAQPSARVILFSSFARAVRPRKSLTVSEHADAHRILSTKASSEAGRWKTSRTPFLKEIMDCMSVRSPVRRVVFISCTQTGKTEVGLNWIEYVVDHVPAPMLVVVPTLEVRKRWVRQRLDPMIAESEVLANLIHSRKRDSANSEDMKDFPGGFLVIGGANSPASLASMPIRFVLLDEVDRFPWEVGKEGDPIGLIDERQKTFPRRKMLLVSTPTIAGASRIEEEYEYSDQRRYHVPCPHCDDLLVFKWDNLKWNKQLTHVDYICEHCGCPIEEHEKPKMLAAGRWIPGNPNSKIRGYHINGLYAPIGLGNTWLELAIEWMKVQNDKPKRKRFINTKLGETWEDRSRDVKPQHLMERAEPYQLRQVPPGCLIITAGIDTQDNRLAVNLLGWGRAEVCCVLDYVELPGNPGISPLWLDMINPVLQAKRKTLTKLLQLGGFGVGDGGVGFRQAIQAGIRELGCDRAWLVRTIGTRGAELMDMVPGEWPGDVWLDLVEMLNTPLVNHYGHAISISSAAIDTGGHHTHDVYAFVRSNPSRRLMAIKGSNIPNKPVLAGKPTWQDINHRGKVIKKGVQLWTIGVDTAKHVLFNRMSGDEQLDAAGRKIRFSEGLEQEYYDMLTAEVFDPEKNKWVKRRGRRNESLDTWVYGYAAAQHPQIRIHAMRPAEWQRLEKMLEADGSVVHVPIEQAVAEDAENAEKPVTKSISKPKSKPAQSDGGSFGSEGWDL